MVPDEEELDDGMNDMSDDSVPPPPAPPAPAPLPNAKNEKRLWMEAVSEDFVEFKKDAVVVV